MFLSGGVSGVDRRGTQYGDFDLARSQYRVGVAMVESRTGI
jgi:hypothetical protein